MLRLRCVPCEHARQACILWHRLFSPCLPSDCSFLPYKPCPHTVARACPPASCSPACRQRHRIRYMHANMEATGLPDASVDMIAVQFVVHECPAQVIENLVRGQRQAGQQGGGGGRQAGKALRGQPGAALADAACCMLDTHVCPCGHLIPVPPQVRECRRLLRPGGTLAIADNNPKSKVIQNLPPVLFTLMKRWVEGPRGGGRTGVERRGSEKDRVPRLLTLGSHCVPWSACVPACPTPPPTL